MITILYAFKKIVEVRVRWSCHFCLFYSFFFSSFCFSLQMFLWYLGKVKTNWNHVLQDLVLDKKLIFFRTMKKFIYISSVSYKGQL